MAIKCTVTTDLQAKDTNGYSGIQKHVEHDEKINHSNQDIVFSETQFNVYDESKATKQAIEEWNNEHFQNYVDQHDQHQREKGHAERQYGSVKKYLRKKKKATGVLTIGNMEVQSELMKQFCPQSSYQEVSLPDGSSHLVFKLKDDHDQPIKENIAVAKKFYGCFNRALINATNNNIGWSFKDKNKPRVNVGDYLHRGRYATNNDEMGISHIHYELATFGMTRGGKKRAAHVTNSLNQALVNLHQAITGQTCSGRAALKWYRASVDQFALKCLEQELHKTYKVPAKTKILDFERKTKEDKTLQTGLSMEQLKAQHQEIADHQNKVKSLQNQADNLTTQNNDVQSQVATVTKNLKATYEATTGHQAVDKDGNDLSPLEMANGITKAAKAAQDDKEKATRDAETAEAKRRAAEKQQTTQAQQLEQQRQQLQTLQQQLDDTNEQLEKRIKAAQQEIKQNDLVGPNEQPITVNKENVTQIEQDLTEWRQEQRTEWETDKQSQQTKLDTLNQQLITARTKKDKLNRTNQDLTAQNTQLNHDNTIMQNTIDGYKNQLVDTIAENDPQHKVTQQLLHENETAEPIITKTGRQQHFRQTLKYLTDEATKALQKVKTTAMNFINKITRTLLTPTSPKSLTPQHLQSRQLDLSKAVRASNHPMDYKKEKQLANDPIIKLQKAILMANTEQLQKANQQTKKALNKQVKNENEWEP
jgi:hypothetical protein